jgi:LmbE family N-acetylglucosaminyl deacetylase
MNNKDKAKRNCIIFLLLIFCLTTALSGFINIRTEKLCCPELLSVEELERIDISKASKLMIVAHPDDETIWGGAHLLEGGYLVVCLTNGNNCRRADEFQNAVKRSGNIPLILSYPDKLNFKRDDWTYSKKGIESDIELIMSAKHWDYIVTHNPEGEYGHIHHKMTSKLTVQAFEKTHCANKLYFFGKYYKAADIEKAGTSLISDDILRNKLELIKIYSSQKRTMEKLSHMFPYENWRVYRK